MSGALIGLKPAGLRSLNCALYSNFHYEFLGIQRTTPVALAETGAECTQCQITNLQCVSVWIFKRKAARFDWISRPAGIIFEQEPVD